MTRFDVDSQHHDPEWGMDDAADWHLFPLHLFNSISIVVSLFGFWVWLFFSPHNTSTEPDVAQDLDRTCTEPDCISQITQNTLSRTSFSLLSSLFFQWVVISPFSGWRIFSLLRQH